MNTAILRSFVEVARLESYTRAAAVLGLSQPAVYQHLTSLQASLGVPLIETRGKRVVLTAEGKSVLPQVLRVIQAEAELLEAAPTEGGTARAGVIDLLSGFTLGQSLLPMAVAQLKERHSGIRVRCRTMRSTREMDEMLLNYGYDAAIHSGRHIPPGLKRMELAADEVMLVTRPDGGSATGHGFSAVLHDNGFIGYGSPSELKSSIENWVGQQDVPVPMNLEFDTQVAVLGAVLAGYGAGAVNYSLCHRHIADGSLVAVRLEPRVIKQYNLVYRASTTPGPALRTLVELIRSHMPFQA